jgi:cysteine-rich repeat protein
MARAATPRDTQLVLAASGAVKLIVRGQGWLRVTQPELVAAGLASSVDPAKLQLFADGVEQAITVTGNADAAFTPDEAVEFFGVGRDTPWTDARTYWLVAGAGAGARVSVQAPAAGAAAPSSFVHDERLVERKNYVSSVLNGEATNFFGDGVAATPVMKTLAAHHLDASAVSMAVLRVGLQGLTATTHQVDVSLNGQLLGTATLGPRVAATFSLSAPNVVEGDNHVTLVSHDAADLSVIASLTLSAPHTYAADGDALAFTAPAATRVTITGFSAPGVRIVDVTDPARPIELAVTITSAGGANAARVDTVAAAGPRTLVAFIAAGAPAAVVADAPSSWTASHDGELLILSHASFLGALAPLVARREQEGWTVQLVDVQDVYDEAGGGDKTPVAIRDFLQGARATWRIPPRFVLLVGDATFDPRNFLGQGDFDFLPTKLIDTAEMETASDDWFVDADLDGVPELAVGRLPVRTADQAAAVVRKTLAYAGTADLPRGGLFVTDQNDPDIDFEAASALSEAKVQDLMPTERFARSQAASTSDALLAKLDAGPFLVNYFGHGSVEVWDHLLTSAQAAALTNAHASIYVVMNCLNGFFHDLYTTSLAESLLEAPQGGAVAVWASSTLAEFDPQPSYNQEFLMHVGRTSLGESALLAKQAITDLDSRRTWLLFGDPTLLGKPLGLPGVDGGAGDGGAPDAGAGGGASAPDAGAGGGAGSLDAGAGGGAGGTAPSDASTVDAATIADAPTMDAATAADGATAPDAGGADDARFPAPPSSAGCGCALDPVSSRGSSALGLLLLACGAAARRRGPRARGGRRGGRRGLLSLLALALTWLAFAPSAHAAYGYRKALTIDRTRIGTPGGATTLTSYPLLIDITDAVLMNTGGGHVTSASGYDISFAGADTATCGGPATCTFNYEIEKYDGSTGRVIAWVQIPSLKTTAASSNTIIYIKYGDATVTTPTQNVNGTWDASFKGVWHLNQSPVTTQTDSTSSAANSTSNGAPAPTSATALIGAGVNISSTTGVAYFDYRSAAFNWTSSDTFTYSGWFNTTDANGPLVSQRDNGAGAPVIDIMLGYDGANRTATAGAPIVLVRDDTNGAFAEVKGTVAVNDGAWHLFTLTRNAGTIQLYIDGTSIGTGMGAGAASSITTGAVGSFQHLGKEGNWVASNYGMASADDRYLAGTFDEYRISKSIRNADWITTDYKTQTAPASTFTAGAETLASCGDGTVGAGESCDDGNVVDGDGCTNTCTIEAGYSCSGSPSSCVTVCGDGTVGGSEACDDGGLVNGDGCSSTCTVEPAYHCTGTAPSVCTFARFNYITPLTINKALVGTGTAPATIPDYPVLISITDANLATMANGGHVTDAAGADIVFRGEDTTTCGGPSSCQLAHEIESYNPMTGAILAWVRVPALKTQTNAASTSINVVYGNQAITTSTQQRTSVWDTNFKGVWHLNQSAAGPMTDSTSNGNDGTAVSLTQAAAQMGSGVGTDGATSYMDFSAGTSLNSPAGAGFTYSTWIKVPVAETTGSILSSRSSTDGGNVVIDFNVGMDGGAMPQPGKLMALVRDSSSGAYSEVVSPTSINDNAWHYVTLTRSSSTIQVYIDTTSQGTNSMGTLNTFTTNLRGLGREGRWVQDSYTMASNIYLQATFDELRYSSAVRDLDWITTDFNAQSAPATFITVGSEVAADGHTDIELLSFGAEADCGGTAVAWQTAFEVDTLGFNVYRDLGGVRVKLTSSLVAGAGVSGGGSHRYEVRDPRTLDAGRTYALETVHFDLTSTWDGPVMAAGGCEGPARPPSTSLGAPTAAATPVAAPGEAAAPEPSADQLGGCSLSANGAGGAGPVLLLALLALARRRRRR